jgi:hypothetical protein
LLSNIPGRAAQKYAKCRWFAKKEIEREAFSSERPVWLEFAI